MQFAAPKTTHVVASSTTTAIESGNTITVYGFVVEGTAPGQVVIFENDGTTVIMKMSVPANDSVVMHVHFVANRGVKVTTPASVTCTVLHSNVL